MKLARIVLAVIIALSAIKFTEAQQQNAWTPQGIEALGQLASSKTNFTFDHSMLVFASRLDPDNENLRRVIAGVNGISVQRYRFAGTGQYDSEALSSVNDEYRAAGWKRVMSNHDKNGRPGTTDLWVRLENNVISNFAVLLAKPNEVSFIAVSGSISPLDLSHLSGHFGIPKIEGGVVVPNSEQRQ